jgi:hypothetical protein
VCRKCGHPPTTKFIWSPNLHRCPTAVDIFAEVNNLMAGNVEIKYFMGATTVSYQVSIIFSLETFVLNKTSHIWTASRDTAQIQTRPEHVRRRPFVYGIVWF